MKKMGKGKLFYTKSSKWHTSLFDFAVVLALRLRVTEVPKNDYKYMRTL